jgi:hypothetical protein
MIKKGTFFLLTLTALVTSCYTDVSTFNKPEKSNTYLNSNSEKNIYNLTPRDISGLEKEYSGFKTKALTQTYFDRKIDAWLTAGDDPKLLKEFLFARLKHPDLAQAFFTAFPLKHGDIIAKPVIRDRIAIDTPFAEFMNPVPDIVREGLVMNLDAGNVGSYSGTGTTWTDLSGNYNGTLNNGVGFSPENSGTLVFDGANDSVFAPPVDFGMNSITINTWVKSDQEISSNIFTGYGRGDFGDPGWWFGFDNRHISNGIGLAFATSNSDARLVFTTTYQYTPGQWILLTGVYDRDSDSINIYANGQKLETFVYVQQGTLSGPINSTRHIVIGRYDDSRDISYFNGNIAVYQLYNRALSANEVMQNFKALKGRYAF